MSSEKFYRKLCQAVLTVPVKDAPDYAETGAANAGKCFKGIIFKELSGISVAVGFIVN